MDLYAKKEGDPKKIVRNQFNLNPSVSNWFNLNPNPNNS